MAFEVTNAGSDLGLLVQTAGAGKDALGVDMIEVVADRGYYKGEDIQACEQAGITAYVARPQRGSAVRDGLFRKEEFAYDAGTDTYRCPNQQRLKRMYWGKHKGVERWSYSNRAACQACTLRPQCTNTTFRKVTRWVDEAVLDRMDARLIARPEILDRRREIVEPIWQHQAMDEPRSVFDARSGRSRRRVQPDGARLQSYARAINLVGVPGLLKTI